jgi:hypothetical protein
LQGLTETQQSALIRCQPEDGMNGFFVALFKKKSHVGTGSESCVEFKFSPPPTNKYESSEFAKPDNQTKNKSANKRKIGAGDSTEQWSTNKKGSKESNSSSDFDSTLVPEKKKKKVRDGRMLTLWKPKKRR